MSDSIIAQVRALANCNAERLSGRALRCRRAQDTNTELVRPPRALERTQEKWWEARKKSGRQRRTGLPSPKQVRRAGIGEDVAGLRELDDAINGGLNAAIENLRRTNDGKVNV